ncbi:hypothetical protein Q9L58_010706 [Maublancomyces gigas]|uniref:Gag protein n=2 Tax=Discina gigas TaxID=1032678 RepID=A0ABR3G3Z0_9PEZI
MTDLVMRDGAEETPSTQTHLSIEPSYSNTTIVRRKSSSVISSTPRPFGKIPSFKAAYTGRKPVKSWDASKAYLDIEALLAQVAKTADEAKAGVAIQYDHLSEEKQHIYDALNHIYSKNIGTQEATEEELGDLKGKISALTEEVKVKRNEEVAELTAKVQRMYEEQQTLNEQLKAAANYNHLTVQQLANAPPPPAIAGPSNHPEVADTAMKDNWKDYRSGSSDTEKEEEAYRMLKEWREKRDKKKEARRAEKKPAPPPSSSSSSEASSRRPPPPRPKAYTEYPTRPVKRPAKEPWKYSAATGQELHTWLLACTDFFHRNEFLWEDDEDRIIYAIGATEGKKVTPFVTRYRKAMSGLDGVIKVPENRYWDTFAAAMKARFVSANISRFALDKMDKVQYTTMEDYLLEMENLNIEAELSGAGWRKAVESRIPHDILKQLHMSKPETDDDAWLEKLSRLGRRHEEMQRLLKTYNKGLPATDGRGKETEKRRERMGRRGDNARAAKDADSAPSTSKPKNPRNSAPAKNEDVSAHPILHTDFKVAHEGIAQTLIDKRKRNLECTRCGRKFHSWNKCRDTDPVTVGAAKARKRKAEDQGEKAEKKPRVVPQIAVATVPNRPQRAMRMRGSPTGRAAPPPVESIWKIDSDEDMSDF